MSVLDVYHDIQLIEPGMLERAIKHDGRLDYLTAVGIIAGIPTMHCAPIRHEKWIDVENGCVEIRMGDTVWKERECTGCGRTVIAESFANNRELPGTGTHVFYNYCPHCGARMDDGMSIPVENRRKI